MTTPSFGCSRITGGIAMVVLLATRRRSPGLLSACGSGGSGAISPTMNEIDRTRQESRSRRRRQAARRTSRCVIVSMTPVNVVVTMPARLEAKFWMPPIEATWPGVGATSPGSDQMLAAVKARLP